MHKRLVNNIFVRPPNAPHSPKPPKGGSIKCIITQE